MAISLIAWHTVKREVWEILLDFAVFFLVRKTGAVPVFSEEGSARIVQNATDVLMPQPRLSEFPFFLQPMP